MYDKPGPYDDDRQQGPYDHEDDYRQSRYRPSRYEPLDRPSSHDPANQQSRYEALGPEPHIPASRYDELGPPARYDELGPPARYDEPIGVRYDEPDAGQRYPAEPPDPDARGQGRPGRLWLLLAAAAAVLLAAGALGYFTVIKPQKSASAGPPAAVAPSESATADGAAQGVPPSADAPSPSAVPSPSPPAARPSPSPTRAAPTKAPPKDSRTATEDQVVTLVNNERAKIPNCKPLRIDERLRKAARGHSEDMARRNFFDHTTPDGVTFDQRINRAGYSGRTMGENIAGGQPTPASVMQSWMNSPGHRQNILNCSYTDIGVGMATASKGFSPLWTQDFGGR